jgi:alpha-tubulin suppressor-like RCC1 family protein
MADGTVMVCGQNANGQLGQNDKTIRSTLVPVLGISSQALAVSCGQNHTAILINDGTVRVCGRNTFGQLGQNDTVDRSTVVSILGISSQAVAVACGPNFTTVLMNDGTVRVCGANNNAQLGQNDLVTRSTVVSILGISSQAVAVACGVNSTTVLINDGTVRVCGRNDNGQLGQNDLVTRSTVVSILGISSQAVAIACGAYHTLVLLNDGTVRACGLNNNGQLGQNDLVTRSTVVSVLGISSQAIALACGRYFTSILMNNGTVRVCGLNSSGQLGQNDIVTRSTVVSVLGISSQAIAVACGSVNMAILMNDGTVEVCGINNNGRLGLNDTVTRSTVVTMLGTAPLPFSQVCYTSGWDGKKPISFGNGTSGGSIHTLILMNDGTVRGCGRNNRGQLGQNDTTNRSTVVSILGISSQATSFSCGDEHTAILMNDGTVRVCGRNTFGQLGLNDLTTRSTVVSILGISSQAIAIACGSYHTVILMNDGTVRACGRNNSGQLGQNDVSTRSTVVSILGISSQAIAVACGQYHTAILMNDGTVRVCGSNPNAQLGLNDQNNRSTVVPVVGISSQAVAIAAGYRHTAILMNDGTVRACGVNNEGQLGQTSSTVRLTPVPILSISSQAIAVACGLYHTGIILNDGTVRTCGQNAFGQLGLNDGVNRSTVVSMLGVSGNTYLVMGSLALGVQNPSLYQLDLSTDNARKLTTTTWSTGSDMRIKSDIQSANLARCSEIIDALDLKYFEWSPDIDVKDRHSLGWIAQDVEQFFPNSVRTAPAHGIADFKNLNSDQLIKAMYGALKNMIQKTYPPTGAADASNTQA